MNINVDIHKKAIIAVLEANRKLEQPKPGEFEKLPRTIANNPLPDIRAVVDDSVRTAVRKLNYEYIPTLSSSQELVFLDTMPVQKRYSNGIEVYKPAYDYETKQVVPVKFD